MQVINLSQHALFVITSLLNLLYQILSSRPFVLRLLHIGESLVCFNHFPLTLRNYNLVLLPLPI